MKIPKGVSAKKLSGKLLPVFISENRSTVGSHPIFIGQYFLVSSCKPTRNLRILVGLSETFFKFGCLTKIVSKPVKTGLGIPGDWRDILIAFLVMTCNDFFKHNSAENVLPRLRLTCPFPSFMRTSREESAQDDTTKRLIQSPRNKQSYTGLTPVLLYLSS